MIQMCLVGTCGLPLPELHGLQQGEPHADAGSVEGLKSSEGSSPSVLKFSNQSPSDSQENCSGLGSPEAESSKLCGLSGSW